MGKRPTELGETRSDVMTSVSDIAVLVVDDDAIVRAWVSDALAGSEFRIAGQAALGADAIALVERRRPDVLLVDQLLSDWTGTELVRELRRRGHEMPALLMTAAPREGLNEAAREAGIQGTVLKSAEPEQLLAALRDILVEGAVPHALHPPAARRVNLSPREREVLELIAEGATNIEIAQRLGIGRSTVKTLISRSFEKLGTHRRSEAVSEAHRLGLLVKPPELDN